MEFHEWDKINKHAFHSKSFLLFRDRSQEFWVLHQMGVRQGAAYVTLACIVDCASIVTKMFKNSAPR
jgi:hypothetical protein